MKKSSKLKVKCLLICVLCLVLTFGVFGQGSVSYAEETEQSETTSFSAYNEGAFDSEEEAIAASKAAIEAAEEQQLGDNEINDQGETVDIPYFRDINSAIKYVRQEMVNRNTKICFFITRSGYSDDYVFEAINDRVFDETASSKEGDYLYWNWAHMDADSWYNSTDYYFEFSMDYLSTAAQEKAVDSRVKSLLSNEFAD